MAPEPGTPQPLLAVVAIPDPCNWCLGIIYQVSVR